MKISKATIARTVVLVIALANQSLTIAGKNPIPYSETEIYEGVTLILTVGASLISWWKNNSFTQKALMADQYKKSLN